MTRYFDAGIKAEIQHGDPAVWYDVTSDLKSLIVEAEPLNPLSCALRLKSLNAKYMKGAKNFLNGAWMRAYIDVRGTVTTPIWDQVFEGIIYEKPGFIREGDDLEIEFVGRGRLQRLANDTITNSYKDNHTYIKDAIDDALGYPDSGSAIGSCVAAGAINTTVCPTNPKRTSILDFVRDCCEECDYAGWMDYDDYILLLYSVGSEAADPAITLTPPYLEVNPHHHINDLFSHIFVWGGHDAGVPANRDALWTENSVSQYPGLWSGINGDVSVSDSTKHYSNGFSSSYSVKIRHTNENYTKNGAALDIDGSPYGSILDARIRFGKLYCQLWPSSEYIDSNCPTFTLKDENLDEISINHRPFWTQTEKWTEYQINVGENQPILSSDTPDAYAWEKWRYVAPATSFTWKLKEFRVQDCIPQPDIRDLYIDILGFIGQLEIDPMAYPQLNPPIKDETAPVYPSVYHHTDGEIHSFEQAQDEGARILAYMKEEYYGYEVYCDRCYPWVRPSQKLTFSLDEYDISAENYVIASYRHEYRPKGVARTMFNLIPLT